MKPPSHGKGGGKRPPGAGPRHPGTGPGRHDNRGGAPGGPSRSDGGPRPNTDRPRQGRAAFGPRAGAPDRPHGEARDRPQGSGSERPHEHTGGDRTLRINRPVQSDARSDPRPAYQQSGERKRADVPAGRGPRPAPQRRDSHGPDARPDPDAPRGALWLYGLHAVAAALANPVRRLRRLLLTEEAEAALATKRPQPWPIQPERAERGRLDQLLGRDTVHQGAALLADPLPTPSLAQVLERPGAILVLDQVNDPRNVGAILRSAAAFGVAAVITQDRNAPEETGALAKAASGALETVPLLRAVNIARTLIALKAAGCWVVGLDAGGTALSGPALAERRVALVVGSEGEGLRRLTRDTCDEIAGLAVPRGHPSEMESLNVSAATAVALYELVRR